MEKIKFNKKKLIEITATVAVLASLVSGFVKLGIGAAAIAALSARVNKLRAKIGLAS